MREELIYRRDCDLFSKSMNYEEMIHDLMVKYHLTWKENLLDENEVFDFARELLQKAQNAIDSAATTAYEYAIQSEDGPMYLLSYDEDLEADWCGGN